jgi:hypothetical protein
MIPKIITRQHILDATAEIDRNGVPPDKESHKFNVDCNGGGIRPNTWFRWRTASPRAEPNYRPQLSTVGEKRINSLNHRVSKSAVPKKPADARRVRRPKLLNECVCGRAAEAIICPTSGLRFQRMRSSLEVCGALEKHLRDFRFVGGLPDRSANLGKTHRRQHAFALPSKFECLR